MNDYISSVKTQLQDWKIAALVLILTVARVVYGWSWLKAGWHKLAWLSDGKLNSSGKIEALIANIAGPEVTRFDPLYLNKVFAWVAQHVFLSMPAFTDFLVVVFEISVGLFMILGFRIVYAALIGLFMNTQFIAGGSFNNFGYIWTNIAMLQLAKYAEIIGLDGFLRFKGINIFNAKKS